MIAMEWTSDLEHHFYYSDFIFYLPLSRACTNFIMKMKTLRCFPDLAVLDGLLGVHGGSGGNVLIDLYAQPGTPTGAGLPDRVMSWRLKSRREKGSDDFGDLESEVHAEKCIPFVTHDL